MSTSEGILNKSTDPKKIDWESAGFLWGFNGDKEKLCKVFDLAAETTLSLTEEEQDSLDFSTTMVFPIIRRIMNLNETSFDFMLTKEDDFEMMLKLIEKIQIEVPKLIQGFKDDGGDIDFEAHGTALFCDKFASGEISL